MSISMDSLELSGTSGPIKTQGTGLFIPHSGKPTPSIYSCQLILPTFSHPSGRLDQDEEQLDSARPPLRPQWPTRQTGLATFSECDNVIGTGPLI
jgi:hypothetical protein